jgi:hypothetical protein
VAFAAVPAAVPVPVASLDRGASGR